MLKSCLQGKSNEITRHLWEIVQDSDTTTREKTNALSVGGTVMAGQSDIDPERNSVHMLVAI